MSVRALSEKPLISILLAIYKPKTNWLAELLHSLDLQTYPNLELIICDDCPEYTVDEKIISSEIKKIPWKIVRNSTNLGSNKTFERLTLLANGEYLAYCDQDDIWLPEKLSTLYETITRENSVLACSDVLVIDSLGNLKAESITNVRRRFVFFKGKNQFAYLLTRNFAMGCTMLVKKEIAAGAVPFINEMIYDHWIALYASLAGKISVASLPLVKYRIHGENQTGVLIHIDNKQTYISERITAFYDRMASIENRLGKHEEITETAQWVRARKDFSQKIRGSAGRLWKLRRFNVSVSLFELLFMRTPDPLFSLALRLVRKY